MGLNKPRKNENAVKRVPPPPPKRDPQATERIRREDAERRSEEQLAALKEIRDAQWFDAFF